MSNNFHRSSSSEDVSIIILKQKSMGELITAEDSAINVTNILNAINSESADPSLVERARTADHWFHLHPR